MTNFDSIFDELIGLEGNYSDDENDPGNWTGGRVGAGLLKGTHWGVSAAAYPKLNILELSRDDAKTLIYMPDFWQKMHCEALPVPVASCLFKEGVNFGCHEAVKLLQRSLGLATDGEVGQITIGRATALPAKEVIVNFMAECVLHYMGLEKFGHEGKGWIRRAVKTSIESRP